MVQFVRPRTYIRIRALSGLGSDALTQLDDLPVARLVSPGANGKTSRIPAFCPYRAKQLGLFIGAAAGLGARKVYGQERKIAGWRAVPWPGEAPSRPE
jgi:hypothetical protein